MKYSFCLYWLFFILSITELAAQSDFRQGYIITMDHDTVYGEIDYRANSHNYRSCLFKKENTITTYLPSELRGYRYLNDKYYASLLLEEAFVEVLVAGELSLYKYNKEFYVQRTGGELYKLEFNKSSVEKEGGAVHRVDSRWKGILSHLTSDCEQHMEAIRGLRLHETSLTRFVIKYHQCTGRDYEDYKVAKPWTESRLRLTTGFTLSSIRPGPEIDLYGEFADLYQSVDPYIGLVFSVASPRLSEKITMQTELQLIRSGFYSLVEVRNFRHENHEVAIEVTTLSAPVLFQYAPGGKNSALFFQLGLSHDYNFQWSSRLRVERKNRDHMMVIEHPAFELSNFQIGFLSGAGIQKSFSRFTTAAALRYNHSTGFRNRSMSMVNINRLSLSLVFSKN